MHKLETLESVAIIPVKRVDMFSLQYLKGQVDTNFEPSLSLCIVSGLHFCSKYSQMKELKLSFIILVLLKLQRQYWLLFSH